MTGPARHVTGPTADPGYAAAQAELVAALTGMDAPPAGFDLARIEIARKALLRKRAGEITRHWPMLAQAFGAEFPSRFADWAAQRPTAGALRDGWDLARDLASRAALTGAAQLELTERGLLFAYDGRSAPRRRRAPRFARHDGRLLVQIGGRVRSVGRR